MQYPGLGTFRYWLFDKDMKPLYVDENGIVLTGDKNTWLKPDGTAAFLEESPKGWSDTEFKWARSSTYEGVFREYVPSLTFNGKAAKIIRHTIVNQGYNAVLYFGMSSLDRFSFPPTYNDEFFGELDLTKLKGQDIDKTVTVTAQEGGALKYLKAFENTQFEFPITTDIDVRNGYIDGFPFNNKLEYTIYDAPPTNEREFIMGMGIVVNEGTTQGILYNDQQFTPGAPGFPNELWHMKSETKTFTANYTGKIYVKSFGSSGLRIRVRKHNDFTGATVDYNIQSSTTIGAGNFEYNVNLSIPVKPREKLYLMYDSGTADNINYTVTGGSILLKYEVTFDYTYYSGFTPSRLWALLVNANTEGKYVGVSTFLDNITDLLFTSGTSLRRIEADKQKIKISIIDFLKTISCRYNVGIDIRGNYISIEPYSYFYQNQLVNDLGIVDDFRWEVAQDRIYNTIKAGYRNNTYDNVNGLDEFNVTQQRKLPTTNEIKELDLISPIRADMTGIELQRLKYFGQDSTDSASDNDTFMLNVKRGGTYKYHDGFFSVIDGDTFVFIGNKAAITNGETFTLSGTGTAIDGTYQVINTSYLVVGETRVRVSGTVTDGDYTGVISLFSSTLYLLNRPAYTSVTGLLHPNEAYNIELSPLRGILANGSKIRSMLALDSDILEFTTGEKNSDLSTTIGGVTITEKADVVGVDLSALLWLPINIKIKVKVPAGFRAAMKTNPRGKFRFTDRRGNIWEGFIGGDGSVKPHSNDIQEFTLIAHPDTDLNKLI